MDEADRKQHDQFLRLFMEHEEALRLFVRSLLFSQDESREVMQEVASVLWRKFDDSLESASFRRWAFGVARMEVLSFRPSAETGAAVSEAPLSLLAPTWLLVIANIYFGINTQLTVNVAEKAVDMLEVIAR